jgi:hypothetical protein
VRLPRWLMWLLGCVLFLALVAGQSWATYAFFTSRSPGGNDFYARWANGCARVWTGENPYSDAVTLQTQIGMYGRPAQSGEDQAAFSYPLYTLFFFWPLCFVRTYPLAHAIWMTLMLYALLAGVVLMMRATRWRPPAWLWGVTLVWAVFNYPHARALILGQMATLVFVALAAAMWALREERDFLAGALLAVATIKPQMSFLLLPWVLWWAGWRRRWGVWKGFGLAMALLAGLSFLLVPTWLADFVAGVRDYDIVAGASYYHSLTWMVTRHLVDLGPVVEAVCVAGFVVYALLEAWQGRQAGWRGFLWTTGLLLVLTHFVAPRTATTHYSILLLPLFVCFELLQRQMRKRGALVVLAIEVVLLVGQWAIFLATIEGDFETVPVYLPLPFGLLAVLALARRWLVVEE